MGTIKNVFRRKGRAFLTIFGITIGVLALVVMGAMAEKLNLLVEGGVEYYGDKVIVTDAGASAGLGAPMSVKKIRDIERVDGVKRASATLTMLLDPDQGPEIGVPQMITATDLRQHGLESFVIEWVDGREIREGETGVVALGSDMAAKFGLEVGDTMKVRGEEFRVVGVADKTLTAPDKTVMMSLEDAQRLYVKDLPAALRSNVNAADICTAITVYPESGVNPEHLAAKVGREVENVKADGPKAFKEATGQALKIFNSIIFGVAMISLLVGGLSVVNTMTMAVSERTREVGIRKAIGATTSAIVRQFVAESAVIGFTGGATGLILGGAIAAALNAAGKASSTGMFLVTTRLALGSLGFAVVLGIIAGIYPALRAAQLNPVQALRYE